MDDLMTRALSMMPEILLNGIQGSSVGVGRHSIPPPAQAASSQLCPCVTHQWAAHRDRLASAATPVQTANYRRHSHIPRQPMFDNHKKYLKWNSVRQIADTVKPMGMSLSGGSRSARMVSNHSPAVVTLLCVQGEDSQQWHGHWGSCHSPAQPELEWEARKARKSSL